MRKPAAVNCLVNVAAPHSGQIVSGASESFCSTSSVTLTFRVTSNPIIVMGTPQWNTI